MSEDLAFQTDHYNQLHFLYMQTETEQVLERLGFDHRQFELTPQSFNLGFPLIESRPLGLDITNRDSGNRIYITGYTDPIGEK